MIIGITGKSGSGKSYVANILAKETDAEIIDIDKISHKTLELKNIKLFVKKTFGDNLFDLNGNIMRKKLGEIVFNDADKLKSLNKICQIEIEKIINKKLSKNNEKIIILDYALLTGLSQFEKCDIKILVVASDDVRKSRIISRDNIDEEYFYLRDKSSYEYDEKMFNFVINNDFYPKIDNITKMIKKNSL